MGDFDYVDPPAPLDLSRGPWARVPYLDTHSTWAPEDHVAIAADQVRDNPTMWVHVRRGLLFDRPYTRWLVVNQPDLYRVLHARAQAVAHTNELDDRLAAIRRRRHHLDDLRKRAWRAYGRLADDDFVGRPIFPPPIT